MSNLVDHARRELELIGEEPETIDGICKVVQTFADMGHSGFSAAHFTAVLDKLLKFQNLKPLTNDPDEWIFHGEGSGNFWQSKRNPEAFSTDGGKTYYFLSEQKDASKGSPFYISAMRDEKVKTGE